MQRSLKAELPEEVSVSLSYAEEMAAAPASARPSLTLRVTVYVHQNNRQPIKKQKPRSTQHS